ncbi:OmpA family protein [Paludibaculum fermentans]|uniref:OmpA family protein n=1 Tax=Paludibaculum fermentans TaxID=1473598 RepID=UPI003EBF331A
MKMIGAFLMVCGVLSAQQPQQQSENAAVMAAGSTPIYRVTVTARTAKAINYRHRSGATKIDFRGTELMAKARGEAKVESKQGYIEIEVEFDDLVPANQHGSEYLTYVLWAITPEGRTSNLGEILLNGTKSKLNVTTELQVFGLVVTAEPYFAVSRPSDLIVMENVVRADTTGKIEEIEAKYELYERGQYHRLSNPLQLKLDSKQPLELYEARNAVQIARAVGADRFATESFQKAEKSLAQAEAYQARKAGSKPITMTAREAVQTAEDSRAIAVKRQDEEALAAERQAAAQRETSALNAKTAAQAETDRVTRDAEAARLKAQGDSERATRDAEAARLKADAEAARLTAEKNQQALSAAMESDRLKREMEVKAAAAAAQADQLRAESDARAAAANAAAERLRLDNEAQRAASQAELDKVAQQKAQLEAEKAALRIELLKQFNVILQTRDTARGLIVNMSDVLFDTGKFSLRPIAREKLARVAGIVASHAGLRLDVEGHTDSVGGDDYNQTLSEHRGTAVRDFLMVQGMSDASVTTKGFGKTQPVATNDTAQGRQQNRRVELVISGEVIGTRIGSPLAAR